MDGTPINPPPADGNKAKGLPGARTLIVLGVLLAMHAGLAIWAASGKSVTADEILHVTQGFFANRHGDFRVQPENGMLPQRLHGLAATISGAPTPELRDNEAWRTSSGTMLSHQFFYETGHDHFPMLMIARSLNVLFSLGAAVLVFCWARHLAGNAAGLVAAACYALDPGLLAHAALATSDLAAVFLLPASLTLFWWQLGTPRMPAILASSLVFGLACVAKYSAVLIVPLMVVLIAVRVLGDRGHHRWWKIGSITLLTHAVVAVLVIWCTYGFRYSGFAAAVPPADHYAARWENVLPYVGIHGLVADFCRKLQLLPEAFLYGYAWVVQSAKARSAFLAGEYSIFGWPSFFPLAFAWKTTLAMLVALIPATVSLVLRWRRQPALIRSDLWRTAPLAAFFALYATFSITSSLNIGHRHILPLYPVLHILLGIWIATLPGKRLVRTAAATLLIFGQALACVRTAPHFLAYFNAIAGGPANGHRLLVDSSLDWGQDLAGLDRWLKRPDSRSSAEPVYLAYFGSGEPNYYGIRATRLPFVNGFRFTHPRYEPRAGIYCISATMLQQVYSSCRGPWTPAYEHEYQELRKREADMLTGEQSQWRRYDELRFARLCHYLQARRPDDMVGYSILIYRLSSAEIAVALDGDIRLLSEAILELHRQK